MGWKVGVDIGGTFTDIAAIGPGGLRHAKTPTTPDDPLAGLEAALAAAGLEWADVDALVHGTTLVTNMLVEDKLAPIALVTTEGFEAVLAIARASRDDLYRLDLPPRAAPLAPAERTFGVRERLDFNGAVVTPLDDAEIARLVAAVAASGVEAVAIALLHAYADPAHEARLAAALRAVVAHVSASHEVSPEAREYERTASTALNAAVMPRATAYLERLQRAVPPTAALTLFHSAGGVATPAILARTPISLALSGPAAGAAASAIVAAERGLKLGLAFDMGGTTTDVCLIEDGRADVATNRKIAGRVIRQPMVGVETVGAGGGSIIRLTPGGLTIGPDSAGADPGPACYGRGGTAPTITDANVALGYLDPDRPLGGAIRLDPERATAAMAPIAASLGRSIEATALGARSVANAVMARALRRVTVRRGVDLRAATLIAYGGAGPMHAVALSRQVGIGTILVPPLSSGFSALGCIAAPPAMTRQKTIRMDARAFDAARLDAERAALRDELAAALGAGGVAAESLAFQETLLIRYVGQSVAVETPLAPGADAGAIGAAFRAAHARSYGYATDEPFLVESLRVAASAPGAPIDFNSHGATTAIAAARLCRFEAGEPMETPVHPREALVAGARIAGPAMIEDAWSTIVLPPGATATVEPGASILIDVGGDAS